MMIAWGATGNERNDKGSVISTNIFLCLLFHDQNFFSPKKKSWTPLHFASDASMCRLLCALDGVDQNAVDMYGETALGVAFIRSRAGSVRALLELNVDTSKARVETWMGQLLNLHLIGLCFS